MNRLNLLLSASIIATMAARSQADTIAPSDFGMYFQVGYHYHNTHDFLVGASDTWRAFVTFDIPSGRTVVGASLSMNSYSDAATQIVFSSYSGSIDELTATHDPVPRPDIFNALGTGTVFASGVISHPGMPPAPYQRTDTFALNAAAIAAINGSQGTTLAFGAATLDPSTNTYARVSGLGNENIQGWLALNLQFEGDPPLIDPPAIDAPASVPVPTAFGMCGSALVAAAFSRRRRVR